MTIQPPSSLDLDGVLRTDLREMGRWLANRLFADANGARYRWRLHRQLFGASRVRLDLINRTAGPFFALYQETSIDDILMRIARITDPRGSGRTRYGFRYHNATVDFLVWLAEFLYPEPATQHRQTYSALEEKLKPVREERNKRIGHLALGIRPHDEAVALDPILVSDISEAFRGILGLIVGLGALFDFHAIAEFDGEDDLRENLPVLWGLLKAISKAAASDEFLGNQVFHRSEKPAPGFSWEGALVFRQRRYQLLEERDPLAGAYDHLKKALGDE